MGWSIRLGTFRDISVRVHVTFALIVVWAAWWGNADGGGLRGAAIGIVSTLLLFLCVTLHEFGHSLTAQRYGIATRDITLYPIGGVASLERIPDKPGEELRIAIAGPVVNVVIAVALLAVGAALPGDALTGIGTMVDRIRDGDWGVIVPYLALTNLWLALFNLLPAFPMDGGRILRAFLAHRLPHRRATTIAVGIGQAMALLFGLIGFTTGNPGLVLIAVFVWMGAGQEGAVTVVRSILGDATVEQAMTRPDNLLTLRPNDALSVAVDFLLSSAQSDFPVVDADNRVVGILTADDLFRAIHDGKSATVQQVMKTGLQSIHPKETLTEVQPHIAASGLRVMPVTDQNGRLVGTIALADIQEMYRFLSLDDPRTGLTPIASTNGASRNDHRQ